MPGAKIKYGLALDHYAFTPLHIVVNDISYGDRPYAGCLSVKSFRIAMDEKKRRQVFTALDIGLMGPATQWEWVQTRLHKNVLAAPLPKGWHHQISNDLILSYKVYLEKNVVSTRYFLLNVNGEAIAGTMNDKLSAGINIMIGSMDDPFKSAPEFQKEWDFYVFGQSFISGIGYDATLQGGMFNKSSPYTLPASQIKRVTLQNQVGARLRYKKYTLELSESFLTGEFDGGRPHIWGGVGIGKEFK